MRHRSSRIAGTVAMALACAIATPPAASAAAQPPAPPEAQAAGLLDDLDAALGGLLGGTGQQGLQGVLGALGAGQAPTGTALTPVRELLYDVAGTQGLPTATADLVRGLADLLGTAPAGEPLDPALLAQLAALLRDLGARPGTPPAATTLLDDVADLLEGSAGTPGLLTDALSLPPQVIRQVDALLTRLQDGDTPTGTLLAPVADLLESVAGTPGLPAQEAQLFRELGESVERTSGALDPLLAGQLSRALSTVAATPGLSSHERIAIERTAAALASSSASGARAATRRDRAVVTRVRVNRARTRIAVRIACPRRAPRTCATTVRARLGARKAAHGKRVRIAPGRSKVVRLTMVDAARAASARSGGRLNVRVVTAFGTQRFAHAKAVQLKPQDRR